MAKTVKEIVRLLDKMDRQCISGNRDDAAATLDEIVEAYREVVQENEKLKEDLSKLSNMVVSYLENLGN